MRKSRQILILRQNSVCKGLKISSESKFFGEGPSCLRTTSATLTFINNLDHTTLIWKGWFCKATKCKKAMLKKMQKIKLLLFYRLCCVFLCVCISPCIRTLCPIERKWEVDWVRQTKISWEYCCKREAFLYASELSMWIARVLSYKGSRICPQPIALPNSA